MEPSTGKAATNIAFFGVKSDYGAASWRNS